MMWATQEEVKEKLKEVQEANEMDVIKHLAERSRDQSSSAKTIMEWNLNRNKVRGILRHLAKERKLQTTFANLIGATRFKAVKDGKLRHTICPRCKEIDSWEHCMQCYGVDPGNGQEHNSWLRHIEGMMQNITTDTPAAYVASEMLHENRRDL